MGEVIWWFWVRYHQYADDTSFVFQTQTAWVMLWTSCSSVWNFWGSGWNVTGFFSTESNGLGARDFPLLIMDGMALPQIDLVHNQELLLDSWLLLKEQVKAIARRAFGDLWIVCQLHPSLDWETLLAVTHALMLSCLDYCSERYLGLPLKSNLEASTGAKCSCTGSKGNTIICELHWLPVCLWVQLKVLVIIFKALHVLGPGYLKNCLFPVVSTCPIHSGRKGIDQRMLAGGEKNCVFSAVAFARWNILSLKIRLALMLLASCRH